MFVGNACLSRLFISSSEYYRTGASRDCNVNEPGLIKDVETKLLLDLVLHLIG